MAKSTGNIARVGELLDAGRRRPGAPLRARSRSTTARRSTTRADSLAAAAAAVDRLDALVAALAAYREDRPDDPTLPDGAGRGRTRLRRGARRRPEHLGGARRRVRPRPRPQPPDRRPVAVDGRRRPRRSRGSATLDEVLGVLPDEDDDLEPELARAPRRAGRGPRGARLGGVRPAAGRARGPRDRRRGHARRPALAPPRRGRPWLIGDGEPQPQRRARKPREAGDVPGPKPKRPKIAKASDADSPRRRRRRRNGHDRREEASPDAGCRAGAASRFGIRSDEPRPRPAHPDRPTGSPGPGASRRSRIAVRGRGPSTLRAARLRATRDRSPPCRALLRQREGSTAGRRRPAWQRHGRDVRDAPPGKRPPPATPPWATDRPPWATGAPRPPRPADGPPTRRFDGPARARSRRPSPVFAATPDGSGP